MTREQYERTVEALVTAIERAETPEAVIRLTELLEGFQKMEASCEFDELPEPVRVSNDATQEDRDRF